MAEKRKQQFVAILGRNSSSSPSFFPSFPATLNLNRWPDSPESEMRSEIERKIEFWAKNVNRWANFVPFSPSIWPRKLAWFRAMADEEWPWGWDMLFKPTRSLSLKYFSVLGLSTLPTLTLILMTEKQIVNYPCFFVLARWEWRASSKWTNFTCENVVDPFQFSVFTIVFF